MGGIRLNKEKMYVLMKKCGVAVAGAAILFAGGACGSYLAGRQVAAKNVAAGQQPVVTAAASAQDVYTGNPIVGIVKRSSPAVVNIDTETMVKQQQMANPFQDDPFFREFFGDDFFGGRGGGKTRTVPQRAKGSGFIVSKEGYILTNNHVVDGADKIKVTLLDGRTFDAKKVGQDPTFDLAVIQIKAKDLPTVPLGDSNATQVGEWVTAIGNPLGFENSVTVGVISAKNRTLQAEDVNFQGFLQTDAAINPGNSGGPLIDMNGNVVGINTAIVPYAQGIGFAIPINMAKQIMEDLIKHGEVRRGWLGATVQPLTPSLVESYKIPVKEGAIISDVVKDSPAEKYGLQRGDVIVKVGGKDTKNAEDVVFAVRNHLSGDKVPFDIYRDGKKTTVEVTLGDIKGSKAPQSLSNRFGSKPSESKVSTKMGISVSENNEKLVDRYRLKETKGLVVVGVDQNSEGAKFGLKAGDVILEVNKQKMSTVDDWTRVMDAKNKALAMLISRNGQTLFISVE